MERKPKQPSLQFCQNQRENKIKKSKLAHWLNYNKAAIPLSPPSVQYYQISIILDSGKHHINTIFVYLFMQELFFDKIHLFKFLFMSEKPRLHQLNITSSRSSTLQASLTAWIFSFVRGNTIKEGKIPYVENKYKTWPNYQAH